MEEKKPLNTLAKMGTMEQIKSAHRTMQRNFKASGRKTMKQKDRYKWRKELMKKHKYKSDNDLW